MIYGKYELMGVKNEQVYAFSRILEAEQLIVLLNFSDHEQTVNCPESAELLLGNYADETRALRPYESRVYRAR